jgi:hypothetical protein
MSAAADTSPAGASSLPPAPLPPAAATSTVTTPRAARIPPLSRVQYATMLGTGFLFQACASGRFSFALAAWLCLLPLAVLVRAGRLPVAIVGAFGAVFFGRLAGWVGVVDDAVAGASWAATLSVLALLAYRHVMRELPLFGSVALPLAIVSVEAFARFGPAAALSLWPLSTTQEANAPLWTFVDVFSAVGISFCVAWAQGAMAGWGESWIAEDPHDQATRERGVRWGAAWCFWIVGVGLHVGGLFRDAPTSSSSFSASVADTAVRMFLSAVAAVVLCVLLIAATVVRVRRGRASRVRAASAVGADSR